MDEFDQAITDYDRAIRRNPAFVEAYRNRGLAHLEKGEAAKGK
jgi:hypothetical protein